MKKRSDHILICIISYAALSASAAMLFYDSITAGLFFLPFFIPFEKAVWSYRMQRYEEELTDQFIMALIGISSSLSAGISPENAFAAALADMEKLFGNHSPIVGVLEQVNSKIRMGQRAEDALLFAAQKEKIQEIYDFAVVFAVAKEKGADFPSVISSCVQIMETRREAEREAKIMIRARQYEQRVMCVIPPGILAYLRLSSGSFMNVLYHNLPGVLIMTACLSVYVFAIYMSEKIGDIRV
ncbi:MAG: type II secretion system F family protein [Lachnospiraceae bacterium]|nr:type II secretion system F family protein [Lachnospiraceae bacterium]